jgi:REP element-mobilizing transposase RayT
MSTHTQIYYHIVYSTKHRKPVLAKDNRERLFRYLWGILKNKNCHLYRINGVEDHIHMLTSLHPLVALADLIRDMKSGSTSFIKKHNLFPGFPGWQDGYGAFTKSHADRDHVIEYIKNQEEHHKHVSFRDELKELLRQEGIEFDEKYLE